MTVSEKIFRLMDESITEYENYQVALNKCKALLNEQEKGLEEKRQELIEREKKIERQEQILRDVMKTSSQRLATIESLKQSIDLMKTKVQESANEAAVAKHELKLIKESVTILQRV